MFSPLIIVYYSAGRFRTKKETASHFVRQSPAYIVFTLVVAAAGNEDDNQDDPNAAVIAETVK